MDGTTAIVLILILVFLNAIVAAWGVRRGRSAQNDSLDSFEPIEFSSDNEDDTLEIALLRCVASMGATPKVLQALFTADRPLTIEEIHQEFPQAKASIPHSAIQRTLKMLNSGPFINAIDGDFVDGRFKLTAMGRSLYQEMISRGHKPRKDGQV